MAQVRECSNILTQLAKALGISMFIIGHVTKEGMIAGPRVLEHIVDTVLYFEGERYSSYRILRAVKKTALAQPTRLEFFKWVHPAWKKY